MGEWGFLLFFILSCPAVHMYKRVHQVSKAAISGTNYPLLMNVNNWGSRFIDRSSRSICQSYQCHDWVWWERNIQLPGIHLSTGPEFHCRIRNTSCCTRYGVEKRKDTKILRKSERKRGAPYKDILLSSAFFWNPLQFQAHSSWRSLCVTFIERLLNTICISVGLIVYCSIFYWKFSYDVILSPNYLSVYTAVFVTSVYSKRLLDTICMFAALRHLSIAHDFQMEVLSPLALSCFWVDLLLEHWHFT